MIKAHQIKLYPTKSQEILLKKSCGVARYSYNWALNKWNELYKSGEKPSAYSLIKLQNSIKKNEMPFFTEVSKNAPQYAIHNVEKAFKNFFNKNASYPKFKKKGKSKDSFVAVENGLKLKQSDFKIHIPRIGKIKCAENLRFEGKVNNVVIKRIADMWFAVVNIEITPTEMPIVDGKNQALTIGIDVGIKTMMVCSNGTIYENPKALRRNLKSLKRLQRGLSRKAKGSNNRRKQIVKVARKHYRIGNIRSNAIHQATTEIVNKYDRIVIETLNVKGMVKNHNLAQKVSDVSFGEISRQLEYKCLWQGKELVKADQWFASSKICSCCGNKKEKLTLAQRTYDCDVCELSIDRDLNAAINLANYRPTLEYKGSKACGDGSSLQIIAKSSSVKHEINLKKL